MTTMQPAAYAISPDTGLTLIMALLSAVMPNTRSSVRRPLCLGLACTGPSASAAAGVGAIGAGYAAAAPRLRFSMVCTLSQCRALWRRFTLEPTAISANHKWIALSRFNLRSQFR